MPEDREPRPLVVRDLARWIGRYADLIERDVDRLTQLDAAIGDGDHGVNMQRGAAAIHRRILELRRIGSCRRFCDEVGHVFLTDVGGAAGALYGTFFQASGEDLGDRRCVEPRVVATALAHGLDALMQRGKADIGDKTMVDAIHPAITSLTAASDAGAPFTEATAAAAKAAAAGSHQATALVARRGRASYLGPRSAGHEDPGAASSVLLFDALRIVSDEGTPPAAAHLGARVGMILVSRSEAVAIGTAEVAGGMAPSVRIVSLGLDDAADPCAAALVHAAIREADEGVGVVALVDPAGALGATGEVARLPHVRVSTGPFVEGAVMAAVLAEAGKPLDAVLTGSEEAAMLEKRAFLAPEADLD